MASLDEDRRRQLRQAISDPGAILPRIFGDGESAHEMLPSWQTRAVEKVIGPWLAPAATAPDSPTVQGICDILARARSDTELAQASMWGAVQGTATRDRWDRAAGRMNDAARRLAQALAALAALEKLEPYCTTCGEPLLFLSAGWSHFATVGEGVEPAGVGHEPELDWRPVGEASDA